MELLFFSAQPHDIYFHWQLEVQITNFRKFGISDKMNVLVWYPTTGLNPTWKDLEIKYPEVKFFYYMDKGVDLGLYIPQLRPQILAQHFKIYEEELRGKAIFYHDSDIIFRELPRFGDLLNDDFVYESDTISYVGSEYLKAKERQGNIPEGEVIQGLADLVGINSEMIANGNANAGGAQYLLKHIDYTFWEDVEDFCVKIRRYLMLEVNKKYFRTENDGFQSWTADMWAVNYALWKRGIETVVTPKLDFSWATDLIQEYHKKPIYHNAGATPVVHPQIFYKGLYIDRKPFGENFSQIDPMFASCMYVEAINEVTI